MDEQSKPLHAGHRERMYESFRRAGLDGFSDYQALELLLTFAIVRRDTNELAHRLLEQFGSFHAVLNAPQESLASVPGMTQRAALLISLLPQLWQRYETDAAIREDDVYPNSAACAERLRGCFRGVRREQAWLMCLDAKCKLLDLRRLSEGSVNATSLPIRRIIEIALAVNATSVVIAHNHTSGIYFPSRSDLELTMQLRQTLASLDLLLADHLIFSGSQFYSLCSNGLI